MVNSNDSVARKSVVDKVGQTSDAPRLSFLVPCNVGTGSNFGPTFIHFGGTLPGQPYRIR